MREQGSVLPASYTICAYMRLSNEDEDVFGLKVESGSITSQRRLIMDFIKKQPEFVKCNVIERCDDGLSGRYFDTRPQFTDMIELAKRGKVNCIIVKDCSRFGRDYVELGDYLEQLFPFLGVRFISINDRYDSDKSEGGLDIAFKNLVYDIYSRDLSKKVTDARRHLAEQGKYIAGQTLYGYRKKKGNKYQLEPDPETAPIVREMFNMKLAGMGTTEIARNLNDRGIPCPSVFLQENGAPTNHSGKNFEMMCWIGSTVGNLLQNEIYTGKVIASKTRFDRVSGKLVARPRDEWICVENKHEPLVSDEDFQKVQRMIKAKAEAGKKKAMHYQCGICGNNLKRRNKTDLYCNRGYQFTKCECRQVLAKEEELDGVVLGELKAKMRRVLDDEELMLQDQGRTDGTVEQRKNMQSALDSVKKAKQMLFEKLADRVIDRGAFLEKKKEYDGQIAELEQRMEDLSVAEALFQEKQDDRKSRTDAARSFLEIGRMTEDVWEKFVKGAALYPDGRLEIRWNFEDDVESCIQA